VTAEELHDRYVAEIDKRGLDDKYIDGVEERELMQIAIQHGFPPERARAVVVDVCREKGYVIEASLVQFIREKLKLRARTDGSLDPAGFDEIVRETATQLARTTRSPRDVQQLVANTMDDAGYRRARPWWQPDWLQRLRNRKGMN
jgi:K+ transporter